MNTPSHPLKQAPTQDIDQLVPPFYTASLYLLTPYLIPGRTKDSWPGQGAWHVLYQQEDPVLTGSDGEALPGPSPGSDPSQ